MVYSQRVGDDHEECWILSRAACSHQRLVRTCVHDRRRSTRSWSRPARPPRDPDVKVGNFVACAATQTYDAESARTKLEVRLSPRHRVQQQHDLQRKCPRRHCSLRNQLRNSASCRLESSTGLSSTKDSDPDSSIGAARFARRQSSRVRLRLYLE